MKKSYLYLFALFIILLILCGCGEKTSSDFATEEDDGSSAVVEKEEFSSDTQLSVIEKESETEAESETETETQTETEIGTTEPEHVHTIGFIIAKAPTCTEAGTTEGKMCSVCKEMIVAPVKVEPKGHAWVNIKAIKPTCTLAGRTEGVKCENCNETPLKSERIEPLGHSWVFVPEKPSTCTVKGYTEHTKCERCEEIIGETLLLPLADHKYIIHMPKEPTCTVPGNELYYSCSACSYEESYEKTLPLGHQYDENFVCTMCNSDASTIQELEFSFNEETNEYTLIGVLKPELVSFIYNGVELKSPKIVIPNMFNGLPVTAIGEYAIDLEYPWNETVISLHIPSSITYIDERAISSQQYVDLYYQGDVEDWCNITFGGALFGTFFGSNFVNLYFNGEAVSEIEIPASVQKVGDYQFAYIKSIKKVTFSEGVTEIGTRAFYASGVEEIELSQSVATIKSDAFANVSLTKINYLADIQSWLNIDIPNPIFSDYISVYSNDGVSESYETKYAGKMLYFNGELVKELVIPEGITEIKKNAFKGIGSIEGLVISEGVNKISVQAFKNCNNLKSITIPKSVAEIGADAFYLSGVTEILYLGEVEDWCNINFDGRNYLLENKGLYINGNLLMLLVIPSSVETVNARAFAGYEYLLKVEIEEGTTKIDSSAFASCSNLKIVELPKTLTEIGDSAFENCGSLSVINFPSNLLKIGDSAFYRTAIEMAILPDTVTEIGWYAFYGCTLLKVVVIPSSVNSIIGNATFYGCTFLKIFSKSEEKPSGWSDNWSGSCPYYWYSEEKPDGDGNYWHYVDGDIHVW